MLPNKKRSPLPTEIIITSFINQNTVNGELSLSADLNLTSVPFNFVKSGENNCGIQPRK